MRPLGRFLSRSLPRGCTENEMGKSQAQIEAKRERQRQRERLGSLQQHEHRPNTILRYESAMLYCILYWELVYTHLPKTLGGINRALIFFWSISGQKVKVANLLQMLYVVLHQDFDCTGNLRPPGESSGYGKSWNGLGQWNGSTCFTTAA